MALVERRLCPEKAPRLVIHSPRLRRERKMHTRVVCCHPRERGANSLCGARKIRALTRRARARDGRIHIFERRVATWTLRPNEGYESTQVPPETPARVRTRHQIPKRAFRRPFASRRGTLEGLYDCSATPCGALTCVRRSARPSPVWPTKVREQSVPKAPSISIQR